jgi:hypothetical protein
VLAGRRDATPPVRIRISGKEEAKRQSVPPASSEKRARCLPGGIWASGARGWAEGGECGVAARAHATAMMTGHGRAAVLGDSSMWLRCQPALQKSWTRIDEPFLFLSPPLPPLPVVDVGKRKRFTRPQARMHHVALDETWPARRQPRKAEFLGRIGLGWRRPALARLGNGSGCCRVVRRMGVWCRGVVSPMTLS